MNNAKIRELCLGKFEENKEAIDKRAEENIEKYRKGDCKICFTDKSGKPVAGKKVSINQSKHDFKYGANVFMLDEFETAEENKKYRDIFHRYFNLATVPFYWNSLEPEQNRPRYSKDSTKIFRRPTPDLCVEYCKEKDIMPKLHCLVYDTCSPEWLPRDDEATIMKLYENRFWEIAERYGGEMYEYEVINELLSAQWHPDETTVMSEKKDILEWSFKLAQKIFPNEKLVINDGNYLSDIGKKNKGYLHPYYMLIESALLKGAPIGKIGIQNHIYCGISKSQEEEIYDYLEYFDPNLIIRGLDILSSLGKPLEITEALIPTIGEGDDADDIQAELFKYLYTIWFSTPLMESAVYWNIIEGTAVASPSWDENRCRGFIFRKDFTPKPAALMLKKLFGEVWHTDLNLTTDENGCVEFRGFFGDYTVKTENQSFKAGIHKGQENCHIITI